MHDVVNIQLTFLDEFAEFRAETLVGLLNESLGVLAQDDSDVETVVECQACLRVLEREGGDEVDESREVREGRSPNRPCG